MADVDIAPGLLKKISADFDEFLDGDKTAAKLLSQIRKGNGTYGTAGKYAERVAKALSKAFTNNLSGSVLPEGRLYWNIAEKVVAPMMEEDFRLVSDATAAVQESLNVRAGIGIKALRAVLDQGQISNYCHKLAETEQFEDVAWLLGPEPLEEYSRSVVDQTLEANFEFQGQSGLEPKLTRTADAGCCEWCAALAGVYSYPDVPPEVYHRHNNCHCDIEYNPGKNYTKYAGVTLGQTQNSRTKQWSTPQNKAAIEERKKIGL